MPANKQSTAVVRQSAHVYTADGVLAATVDEVPTGGGTGSYFTPAGVLEEKTHPVASVFHARLISPDRSVPDQVREAATFDEAVQIAVDYTDRVGDRAAAARTLLEG
jgi:hypothetical protein